MSIATATKLKVSKGNSIVTFWLSVHVWHHLHACVQMHIHARLPCHVHVVSEKNAWVLLHCGTCVCKGPCHERMFQVLSCVCVYANLAPCSHSAWEDGINPSGSSSALHTRLQTPVSLNINGQYETGSPRSEWEITESAGQYDSIIRGRQLLSTHSYS